MQSIVRTLCGAAAAAILVLGAGALVGVAQATELMPDFSAVPTGWSTDRYAPDSFSNVGTQDGRSNVLGIDIGPNGAFNNRPSAYQSTFYDTQGMGHSITGGAGDSLSASLYIPTDWADPTKGFRRTDMWGVMTDGTPTVTGYPIIGYTNDDTTNSAFVGFRVWNDTIGVWIDLSAATVNYGAWNDLSLVLAGANYEYYVNGALADTIAVDPGTVDFSEVIMQAYNAEGDPGVSLGAGIPANDYTALWSNTPVPEPSSLALLSAGLLGLGLIRRRRRAAASV